MNFLNVFRFLTLTDVSVFLDILKYKSVSHVIVLHCSRSAATIEMGKILSKHHHQILMLRIDKNMSVEVPYMYHRIALILNASCEEWVTALNVLEANIHFKKSFVWLFLTEQLDATLNTLSKYPFEVDSDATVIHKNQDQFVLYEVYNTGFYKRSGSFQTVSVGFWNSTLHLSRRSRFDLRGIVLKVPVVVTEDITLPFERHLATMDTSKSDAMHKKKFFTCISIMKSMFNVTYELQRTNSWGYPTNNSFDGMIGALHRLDADIGGSPLFFRSDRIKCSDYVTQIWTTRPCFLFRHPKHPGGYATIYTRPLTTKVWLCILACMGTSAAILTLMLRIKMPRAAGEFSVGDSSPSLACLFVCSAVCQQGMSINRNSASMRMLMFVTVAFAVTLYQYYNATVVSTLLQDAPKNIRTLKDLANSDLKLGVEDVIYNKDFFKRMKDADPLISRVYYKKVKTPRPNYLPAEKGMALVKKGGFAFHVEDAVAYRLMKGTFSEREVCEMQEVEMYPPQNTGAVVKKGSPYKEFVAYGIRKMAEVGILHRLKLVWDEPRPRCVNTPDSSAFSVTIREFSSAPIVLVFGMAVSMLLLLCEILIYGHRKRVFDFRH